MARETRVQSQVIIPKTEKMILVTFLHNTQHYKVRIKGKVAQTMKELLSSLHLCVITNEKEVFGSPLLRSLTLLFTYLS